jgi:cytochrome c556
VRDGLELGDGVFFGLGSEQDVGDARTRVEPEFFQQPNEVRGLARAFDKEDHELARVASSAEVAAVKAHFGRTSDACQACQDRLRKEPLQGSSP